MSFLSNEIYKICLASVPIVSVDVIILNHSLDKILLFKRNNKPLDGVFYTLGGRTLKNESIIDTAIRKLKEEAGIIMYRMDLFWGGVTEEYYKGSIYKDVDTHNVNIFYGYIAPKNLGFQIDTQHSQYQWFDITSHDFHPHVRYKLNMILNSNSFISNSGIINVQG
jgi:colanic acid biosynthesis protein WcaH